MQLAGRGEGQGRAGGSGRTVAHRADRQEVGQWPERDAGGHAARTSLDHQETAVGDERGEAHLVVSGQLGRREVAEHHRVRGAQGLGRQRGGHRCRALQEPPLDGDQRIGLQCGDQGAGLPARQAVDDHHAHRGIGDAHRAGQDGAGYRTGFLQPGGVAPQAGRAGVHRQAQRGVRGAAGGQRLAGDFDPGSAVRCGD